MLHGVRMFKSMKSNMDICLHNFSHVLRDALRKRYPRSSTAKVANEFNLRALGVNTISGETMRKWRSGSTMPSPGHMVVLRDWLQIDFNQIFSRSKVNASEHASTNNGGEAPMSPSVALDTLDHTIKVLLDTRKTISNEMRKVSTEE